MNVQRSEDTALQSYVYFYILLSNFCILCHKVTMTTIVY